MSMKDVTPGAREKGAAKAVTAGLLGAVGHVFVGYLVGMVLSDHIYADVGRTEWGNLWVYFWLFFWPFGVAVVFWFWFLVVALVLGGVFVLRGGLR